MGLLVWSCLAGGCATSAEDVLLVTADERPRLANGEAARRGATIDVERINAIGGSEATRTFGAYIGSARTEYQADLAQVDEDLRNIQSAGSGKVDLSEKITINFRNATVESVLKQLLGGALGVNYIAESELDGRITFRTENPIPKARVLDVVRDILARNGFVLRYSAGVYHVGTREEIAALDANAAAGSTGEPSRQVVKLRKGNVAQVVALARQLLPPTVSLVTGGARNTVIVSAPPSEAASVENLLIMLSEMAVGEDTVAIFPLLQSEPQMIVTKLNEFYTATIRGDEPPVVFVPLEAQRAVLVGTADLETMKSVELMVRQLDRSVSDVSGLRVIPLTHLRAEEIAPQLAQSFGSAKIEESASPAMEDTLRRGVEQRRSRNRLLSRNTPNPDGALAGNANQGVVKGRRTRAGNADEDEGAAGDEDIASTAVPVMSGDEIRIIPDTRNNALLVYSTYRVYNRMREVVQALDVPESQVVIEATVLEVQLNHNMESGVQFFLASNGFGIGSGTPGAVAPQGGGVIGFNGMAGSVSIQAIIKALQKVTGVKVVSSPYLTVLNGQSARLVIGDQIPFATASQSSNNLGNVTVTREIEILDTGIVMEITPRIHSDNSVNLKINQSVSTPVASSEAANNLTPTISTRDIQSQILVQSGRTVLLGGMIQERANSQETRMPKLGTVPVLGNLFKQKGVQNSRTELIILITPRVVRSSSEIEAITRLIQSSRVGAQSTAVMKD